MQPVSRHHAQDPFTQGLGPYKEISVYAIGAGAIPSEWINRFPRAFRGEAASTMLPDYDARKRSIV
jgi:hypothetical protein